MNSLESYIVNNFKKTPWFFFNSITAKVEVGQSYEDDLQELKDKEMIRMRDGINGDLIQMINIEKWNLNNQNNQP